MRNFVKMPWKNYAWIGVNGGFVIRAIIYKDELLISSARKIHSSEESTPLKIKLVEVGGRYLMVPKTKKERTMDLKIKPLRDRIVARKIEESNQTRGGVYVPRAAKDGAK